MRFDPEKATIGFLSLAFVILIIQSLVGPVAHGTAGDAHADDEPCFGEPIVVSYAYAQRMLEPHECKVQCADQRQRYILYSNGVATQCQELPGCNDMGEDRGVTCLPPSVTPASFFTTTSSAVSSVPALWSR